MQKREKVLAAIVVVSLLLLGANLAVSKFRGSLATRRGTLSALEKAVNEKKAWETAGVGYEEQLEAWRAQSLPRDLTQARTLYQNWLTSLTDRSDVRLAEAHVESVRFTSHKGVYFRLPFTVRGRGSLDQMTAFLYHFYRAGHLHKITRLNATPIRDSVELELTFGVEALVLPETERTDALNEVESSRLELASLPDYQQAITGRNVFTFNQAPKLAELRDRTVRRTETLRLFATARDADRDKMKYEIVNGPQGMSVSDTGGITWTPAADEELKDFDVTVRVTDAGLPPLSDERTFKVKVEEAPAPRAPTPMVATAKPRGFNHARFAVLTAVIAVGSEQEAWVRVQTLGQILKLGPKSNAKIGDFEFVVTRIDPDSQTLKIRHGESERTVHLGESLALPDDGV